MKKYSVLRFAGLLENQGDTGAGLPLADISTRMPLRVERDEDDVRTFSVERQGGGFGVKWLLVVGVLLGVSVGGWRGVGVVCVVLGVLRACWWATRVSKESITVMRGLGVQLTQERASGAQHTVFIDREHVQDVVINEGITLCKVVFYLAILVRGKDKLVLVFPHLQPRRDELLAVRQGVRDMLFDKG